MIKYNTEYLLKYRIDKNEEVKDSKYHPAYSKFFGLIKDEERFVISGKVGRIYKDNIPTGFYVKDNKLYSKPKVTLCYVDRTCKEYIFDTDNEAFEFIDKINKITSSRANFIL